MRNSEKEPAKRRQISQRVRLAMRITGQVGLLLLGQVIAYVLRRAFG